MKKRARTSEKKKERKIDRKKGMFKCLLKKTGLEYFYNKFSFFVSSANKEHVHLMGEKLFSNFEKHNLKISSNVPLCLIEHYNGLLMYRQPSLFAVLGILGFDYRSF